MWSIARLILASFLLLTVAACIAPRDFNDPRPVPTPEQRATFGAIGIAGAGVTDPQEPEPPYSLSHAEKAAASVGAGSMGAVIGALMGLGCGPFAPACVPVLAAGMGGFGLIGGVVVAVPYRTEEQVNTADITLRNALFSADMEQRLVELVLAGAPKSSGQDPRQIGYADDERSWDVGSNGEVDTRILIAVPKLSLVDLAPADKRNPPVRMEIVVEGWIYRSDEEAPAFERQWLYDSKARSYFDWAEDQGALVAAEIDLAVATLGAKIVADFLGPESEAGAEPDPPEDVVAFSASESADSEKGDEDGDGFLSKASSFLKSIFSSEPAEE